MTDGISEREIPCRDDDTSNKSSYYVTYALRTELILAMENDVSKGEHR